MNYPTTTICMDRTIAVFQTTTSEPVTPTCFSADGELTTDGGFVNMSKVVSKYGINVLSYNVDTAKFEMSPIVGWIHVNQTQKHTFLSISTEHGQTLHISNFHLIYVSDCAKSKHTTVFAEKVRVGKCLFVKNGNNSLIESKVTDIKIVDKVGVYAPLTVNGNIIVNNILASCYTNYNDIQLQKRVFSFVIWVKYCFELICPVYNYTPSNCVIYVSDLYGILVFLNLLKIFVH